MGRDSVNIFDKISLRHSAYNNISTNLLFEVEIANSNCFQIHINVLVGGNTYAIHRIEP